MSTWKAIAAMAANRVIGKDGALPWSLPEDLKWFKRLTMSHPIVMGRLTYESIGRPLPGRRNIVLSRSGFDPNHADVEVIDSEDALRDIEDDLFVIGGARIYEALLPACGELYLSYVFEEYEGDAYFPPFEDLFRLEEVLHQQEEFELRRYLRA